MSFDVDLFVIGGGSGGVRAARIAAAEGGAMPFGVMALIERWRAVRVLGGRGNSRGRA